jgi:carbon monoxide dehydrogenase subunit G
MATVQVEVELDASAAGVWAVIGDFGAAADLAPGFVTACTLKGDERSVTFASGFAAREKLVTLDDDLRRLVYSARGGRAEHHNAAVEVIARDSGGSVLRWTADILPDPLAPFLKGMMEEGAAAMSRRFASQPREAAA